MFLKISQNSQENTRAKVSIFIVIKNKILAQVFSCEFCEIFKVGLSPSKKNCVICFIEIPLKMIKNAFYLTSGALFVLKIFKFLSWPFGHVAERLDKKDKVNSKFYGVTACLTNNCNRHIAQYSRSKGNQTMKPGQLIEYN